MNPGAFLVTGGSKGIGAAIVSAIASLGHHVGIISRTDPTTRSALEPSPRPDLIHWIDADLTQAQAVSQAIGDWCGSMPWPLDGVVLSAVSYGYGSRHNVQETLLEEWDEIMDVNLRGQFVCISAVLPRLIARPRALILSISSLAAIQPAPGRAAYAASKAGASALLTGLAEELKATNIAVVQAMPKNQVVTPGLKARRPEGFSFEGYDPPDVFCPFVREVVATMGGGYHGLVMAIDGEGRWEELDGWVNTERLLHRYEG